MGFERSSLSAKSASSPVTTGANCYNNSSDQLKLSSQSAWAAGQRCTAHGAQGGNRVEQQIAAYRAGLHDAALAREGLDAGACPACGQQPAAERGGQGVGNFFHTRMQKIIFAPLEVLCALVCTAAPSGGGALIVDKFPPPQKQD